MARIAPSCDCRPVRLWIVAFAAGVLLAGAVVGIPAFAAGHTVVAQSSSWNPDNLTIGVGDTVTFTNPSAGNHNACVRPASESSGCSFMKNGMPSPNWSGYNNTSPVFNTPGTYTYLCEIHGSTGTSGMVGTITVGGGGGTTTTSTTTTTATTTTGTTTTDTGTTPTQTTTTQTTTTYGGTAPTQADSLAPAFSGAPRRQAGGRRITVLFSASEPATLIARVARRAPGARTFQTVASVRRGIRKGANTVALMRGGAKVRAGAYRVTLVLQDAAGNRSAQRVLTFKLA
jgi:plastocyanin